MRNLPNGVATAYEYDGLNRLTRLTHSKAGNTLADFQYQFNAVNNITQMTDGAGAHNYTYDTRDRLTAATHPNQTNESYTFDDVGNRTASQQGSSYTYQTFNRLVAANGNSYSYDTNGNLASKTDASGSWTYTWDYENRLTQASKSGAVTVTFAYDALGRRIQSSGNTAGTTNFVYKESLSPKIRLDSAADITSTPTLGIMRSTLANVCAWLESDSVAPGIHSRGGSSRSFFKWIPRGPDWRCRLGVALGFAAGPGAGGRPSGLGDLTKVKVRQLQRTVNQAGRPLEVVGSAASCARTSASDIDYLVPHGSLPFYESLGLQKNLPGIDASGLIRGVHNPYIGPAIRFEPATKPVLIPMRTP